MNYTEGCRLTDEGSWKRLVFEKDGTEIQVSHDKGDSDIWHGYIQVRFEGSVRKACLHFDLHARTVDLAKVRISVVAENFKKVMKSAGFNLLKGFDFLGSM